jgi:hypothetical protein
MYDVSFNNYKRTDLNANKAVVLFVLLIKEFSLRQFNLSANLEFAHGCFAFNKFHSSLQGEGYLKDTMIKISRVN